MKNEIFNLFKIKDDRLFLIAINKIMVKYQCDFVRVALVTFIKYSGVLTVIYPSQVTHQLSVSRGVLLNLR